MLGRLERYGRWLVEEAQRAGGIGPREHERVADRHVADALMFLTGVPPDAVTLLDVGSGVGLPGIPIAIARPNLAITLLDRSLRRTDLASRAVRILGLDNVSVVTGDAAALRPQQYDVFAFRASLPPLAAADVVLRCSRESGLGLLAVSRSVDRPAIVPAPEGVEFTLTSEGVEVLDSPFWLLRMRRT
jgi:16S rRNA (guanine527-N7)-methyltransferase